MNLYRYNGNISCGRVILQKEVFEVMKETEKGFWIEGYSGKRFVRKEGRKRFAVADEKRALEDFKCRKRKQIEILKKMLVQTVDYLKAAENKEEVFMDDPY